MAEGKEHKFRDFSEASQMLSGGFPVSHILYGHDKESAMCNGITCDRA